MSKFKVNEAVRIKATGEEGVVKAREVVSIDAKTKHTTIQYIVKTGDGFSNWKAYNKKELAKYPTNVENPDAKYIKKVYDLPNGYKLTLVGLAETVKEYTFNADDEPITTRAKTLNIGHAIYNPNDEYNERFGFRIAKNRIKTRPFAHLYSEFTGEFNYDTVVAIMDAKAKYIAENSERFITK